MKTRPILFSGAMVRALLDGSKTQTRRVAKHPLATAAKKILSYKNQSEFDCILQDESGGIIHCPYGKPGDRLLCYHCAHGQKTDTQADTCFTERRLHGGIGRSDLQPHEVQGLWTQGTGGLVSTEGARNTQGLPNDLNVTREQEGHKVCASADMHGLSRHATCGHDGGTTPQWGCIRQQAGEPDLGHGGRELAGQASARDGDTGREAPCGKVHRCGAGAHSVGHQQGLVQPAACGACVGCGAIINSGHRIGGDRLYVRETWAAPHAYDHLPSRLIPRDARIHYAATEERGGLLWRPSIHMPRWASRITLEITGVRVERLQDISEADARAEGARECDPVSGREVLLAGPSQRGSFRLHYRDIWESINGPGSWEANPWVWCLKFKRVEGGAL